MKLFQKLLTVTVLTLGLGVFSVCVITVAPVTAQFNPDSSLCSGSNLSIRPNSADYNPCLDKNGDGKVDATDTATPSSQSQIDKIITQIVNILSVIVGVVAVIFMILGGAKYITSAGDAGKVTSGKNSVIYALVGLLVVALSQVIVRFVLNKV